jgi:FkbM family methyltransferase
MIVNTRRLFCKLLPTMRIDTVCDVGSMDGTDALRFRAAAPSATVYAFEALPRNVSAMRASRSMSASNIQTVEVAVTNFDGEAEFFAVEAGLFPGEDWRGMSSLHRRAAPQATLAATRVKACRLDSFLKALPKNSARVALWIDAEGKGYEVIEGADGLIANVQLVHVEVETAPCIAPTQKLYADIRTLLHSRGFEELAGDRRRGKPQFNVLFIRPPSSARARYAVISHTVIERLRSATANILYKICPACMRRIQASRNSR